MRFDPRIAGAMSALLLGASIAGSANAAGLEANGYDWDLLFDPATYASKASATYVYVKHDIQRSGATVATTPAGVLFNAGFKADVGDTGLACLGSAQNPFGSATDRTMPYAASSTQAASEKLISVDLGLTCSYGMQAGPGVVSIVGGVSAQYLNYDAAIPTTPTATAPLSISDWSPGWRVGVVYEVPEYALRISGIYNSAITYDLSGTAAGGSATATATTPQSFEIKAQSGIAPGWLAFASAKWVNWSVLQTLTVNTALLGTINSNFSYRDTWTLSAGIGHALTEELSVLGRVTWDQGSSTPGAGGVLVAGTQTDRYGVALGAAYDVSESVQISGGVSLSALAAGSNARGESWGTGYVIGVNGGIKGSY